MTNQSLGFIITKPLQLMISMILSNQLSLGTKDEFIIVNSFSAAENIFQSLKTELLGKKVVKFFSTHAEAYAYASSQNFKKLFIDSDVGLRNFKTLLKYKLKNPKSSIAVYEEGLGSYRSDIYSNKKKLIGKFGIGTNFGGSCLSDEIFLFNPLMYEERFPKQKSKVRKINKKLHEFIDENKNLLNTIFEFDDKFLNDQAPNNHRCIIYLTSWIIDEKFINQLEDERCMIIIKPHPHIKNFQHRFINNINVYQCTGNLPAEILINNISHRFNEIVVYHHGSSAENYIKNKNVKFLRIGLKN